MIHLRGKRIFIVEDNAANSTIMKIMLEASGAKVFIDRWSRNTAHEIKQTGQIDLVIMDLMLANGVSGYDVFQELKADEELSVIPAIVVSASDPALEMNKARELGFMGYIAKPINNYTFSRNIALVLQGKQVWNED